MSDKELLAKIERGLLELHDFAKALWGEEPYHYNVFITEETYGEYKKPIKPLRIDELYLILNWQYHLQQMVIADDPIKYLGEHLDG